MVKIPTGLKQESSSLSHQKIKRKSRSEQLLFTRKNRRGSDLVSVDFALVNSALRAINQIST